MTTLSFTVFGTLQYIKYVEKLPVSDSLSLRDMYFLENRFKFEFDILLR